MSDPLASERARVQEINVNQHRINVIRHYLEIELARAEYFKCPFAPVVSCLIGCLFFGLAGVPFGFGFGYFIGYVLCKQVESLYKELSVCLSDGLLDPVQFVKEASKLYRGNWEEVLVKVFFSEDDTFIFQHLVRVYNDLRHPIVDGKTSSYFEFEFET